MNRFYSVCVLTLLLASPSIADESGTLDTVIVTASKVPDRNDQALVSKRLSSGDISSYLQDQPGLELYSGGGISSLPVMHGMNDERIKVLVDGTSVSSACANHMNPPLSYVDPFSVSEVQVESGAMSVANGGDSIAGTISVLSQSPVFATGDETVYKQGEVSSIYRSNNDSITESLSTSVASRSLSLGYAGTYNKSNSYIDGHGDKVRSTQYEAWNHALTFNAQNESHLATLKGSVQSIPYQGYVNQYMDMVDNFGQSLSLSDEGKFGWGKLDTKFFWQQTDHEMGFFSREKLGIMPMNVDGSDFGYSIKTEIPVKDQHTLRFGNELHRFNLDDRWPAVPGSMMMGPQEYVNINHGHRQVLGTYAEWEYKPTSSWTTLAGIRDDVVQSNTGDVQPYNWMGMMSMSDAQAAQAFNARDRAQTDNNIDLTLHSIFEPNPKSAYELGYSRKTRSPNLYERYAWGRGRMAMTMIGWFGDGNGYVGDPDLKPETANTISSTIGLHDPSQKSWKLGLTPYYTYIENYIDVDKIGSFNPLMAMGDTKSLLQFANHDAQIHGLDLTGSAKVWESSSLGEGNIKGLVGWIHGRRTDSSQSLYHIMPFNGRISLEQTKNGWTNALDLSLVDQKSQVDSRRNDLKTAGYSIVNIRTSYKLRKVRLDLGITNLLDKYYFLPLGGVDYADWKGDGAMGAMHAVAGAGRSFNAGITLEF